MPIQDVSLHEAWARVDQDATLAALGRISRDDLIAIVGLDDLADVPHTGLVILAHRLICKGRTCWASHEQSLHGCLGPVE